jgi:hypothetical protein
MIRAMPFGGHPSTSTARRGLHDARSTGAPRPRPDRSGLNDPRSTRPAR